MRLVTAVVLAVVTIATGTSVSMAKQPYPTQSQVDAAKKAASQAADTVAGLQAQYDAASARLAAIQDQVSAAAEVYDEAMLALQAATDAAAQATAAAAAAQKQADAASLTVRRLAAVMYQTNGSLSGLEAYLSSTGPQDLADRAMGMAAVSDASTAALAQATQSANLAVTARAQAERAQAQQAAAATTAEAAKAAAQAKADAAAAAAQSVAAEQKTMIAKMAQLQKISVATEKARQEGLRQAAAEAAAAAARARAEAAARAAAEAAARAAAEAARQRQQQQSGGSTGGSPDPAPSVPANPSPRGGTAAVLAYARAQLGKWYVWGGAGPDGFDCSGLTMMAWRQAGVYLPHGSQAQYALTQRVAIADLLPGDLVFYGTSGATNHHVGIYVGNGQMIEAPHTGAQVRYASIYRSDLLPYGGRP